MGPRPSAPLALWSQPPTTPGSRSEMALSGAGGRDRTLVGRSQVPTCGSIQNCVFEQAATEDRSTKELEFKRHDDEIETTPYLPICKHNLLQWIHYQSLETLCSNPRHHNKRLALRPLHRLQTLAPPSRFPQIPLLPFPTCPSLHELRREMVAWSVAECSHGFRTTHSFVHL